RMLLERASEAGGLKLTATGNLARGVVGQMIRLLSGPVSTGSCLHSRGNQRAGFPTCAFCPRTASGDEVLGQFDCNEQPLRLDGPFASVGQHAILRAWLRHFSFG